MEIDSIRQVGQSERKFLCVQVCQVGSLLIETNIGGNEQHSSVAHAEKFFACVVQTLNHTFRWTKIRFIWICWKSVRCKYCVILCNLVLLTLLELQKLRREVSILWSKCVYRGTGITHAISFLNMELRREHHRSYPLLQLG